MSEWLGAEQSVLVDAGSLTAGSPRSKAPVDKTFRVYDQGQPMLLPPDLRAQQAGAGASGADGR
jgi:hypothetical protein